MDGLNMLDDAIQEYYSKNGNRHIRKFKSSENKDWGWHYLHYLVDRRHVIRYGIGQDRNVWVGGLELAIGPSYFEAADFWSYANSERFTLEASTEGVERNLALLDEFLGYK